MNSSIYRNVSKFEGVWIGAFKFYQFNTTESGAETNNKFDFDKLIAVNNYMV